MRKVFAISLMLLASSFISSPCFALDAASTGCKVDFHSHQLIYRMPGRTTNVGDFNLSDSFNDGNFANLWTTVEDKKVQAVWYAPTQNIDNLGKFYKIEVSHKNGKVQIRPIMGQHDLNPSELGIMVYRYYCN